MCLLLGLLLKLSTKNLKSSLYNKEGFNMEFGILAGYVLALGVASKAINKELKK